MEKLFCAQDGTLFFKSEIEGFDFWYAEYTGNYFIYICEYDANLLNITYGSPAAPVSRFCIGVYKNKERWLEVIKDLLCAYTDERTEIFEMPKE